MANFSVDISDREVADYARDNFEIDYVFSDEAIVGFVSDADDPGHFFTEEQLQEWAEENGYKKEKE